MSAPNNNQNRKPAGPRPANMQRTLNAFFDAGGAAPQTRPETITINDGPNWADARPQAGAGGGGRNSGRGYNFGNDQQYQPQQYQPQQYQQHQRQAMQEMGFGAGGGHYDQYPQQPVAPLLQLGYHGQQATAPSTTLTALNGGNSPATQLQLQASNQNMADQMMTFMKKSLNSLASTLRSEVNTHLNDVIHVVREEAGLLNDRVDHNEAIQAKDMEGVRAKQLETTTALNSTTRLALQNAENQKTAEADRVALAAQVAETMKTTVEQAARVERHKAACKGIQATADEAKKLATAADKKAAQASKDQAATDARLTALADAQMDNSRNLAQILSILQGQPQAPAPAPPQPEEDAEENPAAAAPRPLTGPGSRGGKGSRGGRGGRGRGH